MRLICFVALAGCLFLSAFADADADDEGNDDAEELDAAEFDAENELAQQNADAGREENDSDVNEQPFQDDESNDDEPEPNDQSKNEIENDSALDEDDLEKQELAEMIQSNDAKPGWRRRRSSRRRRSWSLRRRRSSRRRSWSLRRRRSSRRRRRFLIGGRRRRFFTRRYWRRKFLPACRRFQHGFRKGAHVASHRPKDSCKNPSSSLSLRKLAECWAPKIYLAIGEPYKPSSVEFFLSHVKMVWSNGRTVPGGYSLNINNMPVGSGTFLSTKARLGSATGIHSMFYGQNPSSVPIYVLHRTFPQNGKTVLDFVYWAFFPYNLGKNVCIGGASKTNCFGKCRMMGNHVGDWEHVTIRLVDRKPSAMYISAHNFGGIYLWNSASQTFAKGSDRVKFSSDGHPTVFCAYGSHGMWTTNNEHVYKKIKLGERLTDYTSTGTAWNTWNKLILIQHKYNGGYTGPDSWLNYKGRWGNKEMGCGLFKILKTVSGECSLNSGPTGPNWKKSMRNNALSRKK